MSLNKKIKGFTLVELIVVIAIISILAGIGNITVQSYVRNARRETANDNAQLIFTGFQNIVTQCEIAQNSDLFTNDRLNTSGLKYAVVTFTMWNADVHTVLNADVHTGLTVVSGYKNGTVITDNEANWIKGDTNLVKGSTVTKGEMYEKMRAEILNVVGNSFEGDVKIYIDFENYEVKSVIYQMLSGNTPQLISEGLYKQYDKWYYGLDDPDSEKLLWDGKKATGAENTPERMIQCGVYPYQSLYT